MLCMLVLGGVVVEYRYILGIGVCQGFNCGVGLVIVCQVELVLIVMLLLMQLVLWLVICVVGMVWVVIMMLWKLGVNCLRMLVMVLVVLSVDFDGMWVQVQNGWWLVLLMWLGLVMCGYVVSIIGQLVWCFVVMFVLVCVIWLWVLLRCRVVVCCSCGFDYGILLLSMKFILVMLV